MDDASLSPACSRQGARRLLLVPIILVAGCTTTWVGTTAKSFIGRVRNDPDPNVRYHAYAKLGDITSYDTPEQRDEAVRLLMDKFENGREPTATRAIICRSLGKLEDPKARPLLIKAVNDPEAVIKIEACRALGRVGQPEDATVLARVMSLDNLEDARIAAIEGISHLKTKDPRIYQLLVDGMEHDDPAIRLASLNALRKLTRKDYGTDPVVWRRELKSILASSGAPTVNGAASPSAGAVSPSAGAASTSAGAASTSAERPISSAGTASPSTERSSPSAGVASTIAKWFSTSAETSNPSGGEINRGKMGARSPFPSTFEPH